MKFHSAYDHPVTVPESPFVAIQPTYERRVQPDGTLELEQVGTKNLAHEIQAGAVGLTPYEVLDRYARCPDPSILKEMEKNYADFTACPRSLAELEQFRIDARNAFYSLPANVRQLFDNNFNVFMQNPTAFDEFLRGFTEQGKKEAQQAAAVAAEGGAPAATPGAGAAVPSGNVQIQ